MIESKGNPRFYDEESQQVVDALYKETRKWRLLILGAMIGACRRGKQLVWSGTNVYFLFCPHSVPNIISKAFAWGNKKEKSPDFSGLLGMICSGLEPLTPTLSR